MTIALSGTVFELFDVIQYRDLEIWVRDRSRSLTMVWYRWKARVQFPIRLLLYMALSCIVCDLLVEDRKIFYTPPVFSDPAGRDPVGISRKCLILIKLK